MKQVKPDQKERDIESKKKIEKQKEDERRAAWFDDRKNDALFQKYIVEEILQASINKLSDIRFMDKNIFDRSAEEIKSMLVAMTAARNEYEKNLSKILNS